METIKNLTGEDFYDCTLLLYDNNGKPLFKGIQLGDFMMGESRRVKDWDGKWALYGCNRDGVERSTRLRSSGMTTFYKQDVIY